MRFEHWIGPDDGEHTLIPADAPAADRATAGGPGARFCCTIEAADRDGAMRRYHEHLGWEPYRPAGAAG